MKDKCVPMKWLESNRDENGRPKSLSIEVFFNIQFVEQ